MRSKEYLTQTAKRLTDISEKYTKERYRELNESDRKVLEKVLSDALIDFGNIVFVTEEVGLQTAVFCEITDENGRRYRDAEEWIGKLLWFVQANEEQFGAPDHLDIVIEYLEKHGFAFKPIKLTRDDEYLVESARRRHYDHTADSVKFEAGRFEHRYCEGRIARKRTSRFKDVLFCADCGLRVIIPTGLQTIGDIRRALSHLH